MPVPDDDLTPERLVRLHAPRLLAVARRLLAREEDARGAVRDAFAAALASRRGCGPEPFRTRLQRHLVNAALGSLARGAIPGAGFAAFVAAREGPAARSG